MVVPTYGLAEHTVFVCSGGKQQLIVKKAGIESGAVYIESSDGAEYMRSSSEARLAERGLQSIVGCGYPKTQDQVELYIIDPETKAALGSDKVGEIWVTSPSKAMGYWGNLSLTQEDFHAIPSSGGGEADGGYLRTGDLGFLHMGELFICGRSKDLIIVRGSNHYPQDIERTAEKSEPRLRPGCSAAFSLSSSSSTIKGSGSKPSSHTESVVFVAEVNSGDGIEISQSTLENVILSR